MQDQRYARPDTPDRCGSVRRHTCLGHAGGLRYASTSSACRALIATRTWRARSSRVATMARAAESWAARAAATAPAGTCSASRRRTDCCARSRLGVSEASFRVSCATRLWMKLSVIGRGYSLPIGQPRQRRGCMPLNRCCRCHAALSCYSGNSIAQDPAFAQITNRKCQPLVDTSRRPGYTACRSGPRGCSAVRCGARTDDGIWTIAILVSGATQRPSASAPPAAHRPSARPGLRAPCPGAASPTGAFVCPVQYWLDQAAAQGGAAVSRVTRLPALV